MADYVEVPLPDGSSLVVQADEDLDSGVVPAGRIDDVANRAGETFESAMVRIRVAAQTAVDTMQRVAQPPDEITVAFSIKLATAVGVVIANTSAEANLTVTLRWSSHPRLSGPAVAPGTQPTSHETS